ncbi:MAG: single-stranded-DNA-specific exonuclease RecJ [Gammaproteobacteria bacterium]|nr:single-stranded-DNA-specific exonuclease RecJ [Gammaproteobacteria bacterium]
MALDLEQKVQSALLARLFAQRGIVDQSEIDFSLGNLLPPDSMKGLTEAANVVASTIVNRQKIIIVGDFDADGATSTALMVHCLRACDADVDYLVPNRFEFGYGLTPEIVAVAAKMQPALIVTVDNGISSVDGVGAANALGIETVITDHHLPGDVVPAATAIVNPNQTGCAFPSKALAGVGVSFYLLSAVRKVLRQKLWFEQKQLSEPLLADYLDLVALGTIADVVPFDKNNRVLVNEGIRRMRAGKIRPGIRALLAVSGTNFKKLISRDIAFGVAPRLNAAGRLEDMSIGIECLLSETDAGAVVLAEQLDGINKARRSIEDEMKDQAIEIVKAAVASNSESTKTEKYGVCLYNASWHQGVVGIIASRIKDRVHRPTIAFAKVSDTEIKGSARSIHGLHIRDALDAIATANPGLIDKFGGHAMAAGLSLPLAKFAEFAALFDAEARKGLSKGDLEQQVVSDGELEGKFNLATARKIAEAAPWGQGFPEPVFDGEFEIIDQRILGSRHLKLRLLKDDELIDAIAFNHNRLIEERIKRMAYRIDINEYRGLEKIQLIIEAVDLDFETI